MMDKFYGIRVNPMDNQKRKLDTKLAAEKLGFTAKTSLDRRFNEKQLNGEFFRQEKLNESCIILFMGQQSKNTPLGAIRNAELVKEKYPNWQARFYVGLSVPSAIISELLNKDAHVIQKNEDGNWNSMFGDIEAAADPEVDVMISRDCDSRITG
jgi:hypothetical protein